MGLIDRRMQSFVQWRAEVPPEAKRLEDFEAREHTAAWLRFNLGEGIAGGYVIGFQCHTAWWSYFFEHIDRDDGPEGAERWVVEAYDSRGGSWTNEYLWWPSENRWTPSIPESRPVRR
ncbi:MAG: hypothetical protein JWO52_5782 [Gammaproteobacteria bacterium]|nr:hypothetical protein [Gammaproteobacteria bacterium]